MTDRGRLKSPHHACQSAVYETLSNFDQVIKTIFEKLTGVEFLHSSSSEMFFSLFFFFSGNYVDMFIVIKFTEFSPSAFVKKCFFAAFFILPGICHCRWLKKKSARTFFRRLARLATRNTTWHPWDPEWQGKDGQWSVIHHTQKSCYYTQGGSATLARGGLLV